MSMQSRPTYTDTQKEDCGAKYIIVFLRKPLELLTKQLNLYFMQFRFGMLSWVRRVCG
jgi:hypothetical protein